ncbi:hypothetical protein PWG15_16770 [Ensifer adhaerens]|uniref:hypothetical protein n=1 Tax=Ensifer adhaerens TaxID=106592 RepID=UPI0023A9E409|nr:hypothetical protein [Ensifer adhaerens]WDZ76234.1 hypothetical protein PWG15_16770 [Ensifer adhaerens]
MKQTIEEFRTEIIPLVDGKLFSIASTIVLDGRVSAYPANVRGYALGHCYLLKEANDALLLDSGYSAYRSQIIESLRTLLLPDDELSIYPLRLNEYMSVCNVEAIANTFRAKQCYSGNPDASLWVAFSRHSENLTDYKLKTTLVARKQDLRLGGGDGRILSAFQAPIRLIGTRWVYDRETQTLFTSDSFTHQWQLAADEPATIRSRADVADMPFVRSFLLNTRYWWLEGGKTAELCRKLDAVRSQYPITRIAPGYGKITEGFASVEKQFDTLIAALEDLDQANSACAYVDRELIR